MSLSPMWLLVAALAAGSAPQAGPTLAREDTMQTTVPEVLVHAPRVTLDEILERVARGEARRDSLLEDQAVTVTVRMVRNAEAGKRTQLLYESVSRVYRKRPDRVRSMTLRTYRAKRDKGDADVDAEFSPSMREQLVNFAFEPAARREFRYRLLGRDLVGGHLIYRLAFEPRSPIDPTRPAGVVWVDTNEFVIVREELRFERSPVPLLLKGIPRMVIERERVDDVWVLARVLARIETTLPLPGVGRSFDFAVHYDDYALNAGIDDDFFAPGGRSDTRGQVRIRVGR